MFIGIDTHALSEPAYRSALEVLAANDVVVQIAVNDEYTPTPAVSHAILAYNRGRTSGLADGIVITPSHNPPDDGGFKYNPPHGGPAGTEVTGFIEAQANELLGEGLAAVRRVAYEKALRASTTHRHDFLNTYVADLGSVVDLEAVRGSGLKLGVDPLGGAGVHYWAAIAERYGLNLTITNPLVDATFRFMDVDWDGRIRMDPSSPYAMQSLIGLKDTLRRGVRLRHRSRPSRRGGEERRAAARRTTISPRAFTICFHTGPNGARRQPSARPPCRAA